MTSIENVELDSVISEWNDYSEKRKRWKELGFLEGLSNHREQVVVENYEEAVEWFKTHHYSDSEGNWEVVTFPIARTIGEKGMFGAEKLNAEEFFNMIENGLLTASENDSREDFNRVPNLKKLLVAAGKPGRKKKSSAPPIIA